MTGTDLDRSTGALLDTLRQCPPPSAFPPVPNSELIALRLFLLAGCWELGMGI